MRNQFVDLLTSWAMEDPSVHLIVGDLGYGVIEKFQSSIPDQFTNAGIAEQSMVGMAAGMASEGLRPFVYSIANFPTYRAAEQIRNDVAHHQLAVTIVSVGGGLVYGSLGYSHHAIQDYALMRAMPEITILAPADQVEMDAAVEFMRTNTVPTYLRIGNPSTGTVRKRPISIQAGKPIQVAESSKGNRKMVLVTGAVLELVHSWMNRPRFQEFDLYTLPAWGSRHREPFVAALHGFDHIITVEDHLLDGGFGSWVLESFAGMQAPPQIEVIALDQAVTESVGKEDYLRTVGGLIG